jgi:hypothetical protein
MGASGSEAGTPGKGRSYRCFLVRCRLVEGAPPEDKPAWRFTVEQVRLDAARRCFASLGDVAAYLEAELTSCESLAACEGAVQLENSTSVQSEVEP